MASVTQVHITRRWIKHKLLYVLSGLRVYEQIDRCEFTNKVKGVRKSGRLPQDLEQFMRKVYSTCKVGVVPLHLN
jgi:hypothetical protein